MQIKDIKDNYTRDLALFYAKKDRERWGHCTKIDTLMDLYLDWLLIGLRQSKVAFSGVKLAWRVYDYRHYMVKPQSEAITLKIKDIKNDHTRSLAIKRAKESESRNGSHVEESTIMELYLVPLL